MAGVLVLSEKQKKGWTRPQGFAMIKRQAGVTQG